MTATRQARHKARARAAAEPYRQEAIYNALMWSQEREADVIILGASGAFGVVTEIEKGKRVELRNDSSTINVPWRMIDDVILRSPLT